MTDSIFDSIDNHPDFPISDLPLSQEIAPSPDEPVPTNSQEIQNIDLVPPPPQDGPSLTISQEISLTKEMLEKGMVNSDFLRERLPSLWDIYWFLRDVEKICLPPWKSKNRRHRWISHTYFEGLLTEKYFCLKRNQVKAPVPRIGWISKRKLIDYLEKEVEKPLGFNFTKEPPTRWIIKMLYSVNPEHRIFKPQEEKFDRQIPQGILEKLMQLPAVKMKGSRTFPKVHDVKNTRKLENVQRMKKREMESIEEEEKILEMKKRKLMKLEQMAEELELEVKEANERPPPVIMEHVGAVNFDLSDDDDNGYDDSSDDGYIDSSDY